MPSLTSTSSPSENKWPLDAPKTDISVTPPASPQKRTGLISPKKFPRIPQTPHRPSTDTFWSQHIVNQWNDEFFTRDFHKAQTIVIEDDKSRDYLPSKSSRNSPKKRSGVKLGTKKAFEQRKQEIAECFLVELDKTITTGKISEMAASTGGVSIIWNKKLNTTAGRANWRREALKPATQAAGGNPNERYKHYASIELAEKVIDDEVRLLNVIAHEFCHLANFMVSGVKNNPHGKEFKAWAEKCTLLFGHRGIEVSTKHSYVIDYKYAWECTNCGTKFERHSRSIDPARHQCSLCKSKLIQTKPVPRADGTKNEYQIFVKENMKRIKQENPGSPQKDIMGMVGKQYREFKASKVAGADAETPKIDTATERVFGPIDSISLESCVDAVVRKLDFLDLTTP